MSVQPKSKLPSFSPPHSLTEWAQAPSAAQARTMRVLAASATTSMLTTLAYLFCRLRFVVAMPQQDQIIWAVLLLEVSIAVSRLFTQLTILGDATKAAVNAAAGSSAPPKKNLDTYQPRVDVLVTYCGEGIDIVLNTARAACVQDYPPSLLRVFVLDDSHSSQLEEAVLALQSSGKHPNLYYACRGIHVTTHSRAANLNFGIKFASTLPGPAADCISVLDVDMIPSPHWLKTVLATLHDYPAVALVCAAQRFYNLPPSDSLGMNHELTRIECLVSLQTAAHGAWCTGSGYVIRRAALEQIGGIPEGLLQDDVLTSMLLSAAGWHTTYASGDTQWGLAADTMASWLKQLQRWVAGGISVCQFACSPQARHIPVEERRKGLLWAVSDTYTSAIWTLSMIVLPLAILTGKPLLPHHQLRFQLRFAALDFVAQSVCYYLLSSLLEFRMSMLGHLCAIWTAPLRLAIACKYILPSILGRPLPRFRPTGVPTTGGAERVARKKGTSFLTAVLWECGGWMHLLCLTACLAGIMVSIREMVRVFDRSASNGEDLQWCLRTTLEAFIVRIGWPPLFLLLMALMKNAWVPIAHGISPPPLVESKDLLCESVDTGVFYPSERVRRGSMEKVSQSFWYLVAVFHLAVVVSAEVSN